MHLWVLILSWLLVKADNVKDISDEDLAAELSKLEFNNEELEILKTIIKLKDNDQSKKTEENNNDDSILEQSVVTLNDEMSKEIGDERSEPNNLSIRDDQSSDETDNSIDLDEVIVVGEKVSTADVMIDLKARTGAASELKNETHERAAVEPLTLLTEIGRNFGTIIDHDSMYNPYNNFFNKKDFSSKGLSKEIVLNPEYNGGEDYPYAPFNFESYVQPARNSETPNYNNFKPYWQPTRRISGIFSKPFRVT